MPAEQETREQLRERLWPDLRKLPWYQRLRFYAAKGYDWGVDEYIERLEAELQAAQEREQDLLRREHEALKRAVASQERERALREALTEAADYLEFYVSQAPSTLGDIQAEANVGHYRALAAQRTESATTEEPSGRPKGFTRQDLQRDTYKPQRTEEPSEWTTTCGGHRYEYEPEEPINE